MEILYISAWSTYVFQVGHSQCITGVHPGRGRPPLPFFENQKRKCPDFGKNLCIKFSIQNIVLILSKRIKL